MLVLGILLALMVMFFRRGVLGTALDALSSSKNGGGS